MSESAGVTHDMPPSARFTVNTRMLARAQIVGFLHSGWALWATVVQVVLYLGVIVLMVVDGTGLRGWTGALWLFLPTWTLASALLLPYVSAAWRMRFMPMSWRERSLGVGAAGVSISGGDVPRTIAWSELSKVIESREFFLFIQWSWLAAFVPKSAFSTTQAVDEFRRLLVEAQRLELTGAASAPVPAHLDTLGA